MARSPDRGPPKRLALAERGRALIGRWRRLRRVFRRARMPERLLFAPRDLRTADPSIGTDLAAGIYPFAGTRLAVGGASPNQGASPFRVAPPSEAWLAELTSFDWLRHLRDEEAPATRELGRRLVEDALFNGRRRLDQGGGASVPVVARRLSAMLAHSATILTGADHGLYRAYLRRIALDNRVLRGDGLASPRPRERLAAAIGLCLVGLCCAGYERQLRAATRRLEAELAAQILPDGGHVGRNPADLVDLLLDLLPLRQLFAGRQIEVPPGLERGIDRMLPMLRFFQHGSGDLALFNGMGRTSLSDLAAILSLDKARAAPVQRASASGYDRIQAGRTLVIVETGAVPPLPASAGAHAGCLAFELSSGPVRIVVNCGAPALAGPAREAARRTAAHSTLILGATSSARPLDASDPAARSRSGAFVLRRLGPVLLPGPRHVGVERGRAGEDAVLSAHHDGYLSSFGATHSRRLRLSADGSELEGEDALAFSPRGAERDAPALLRFHLHPAVRAEDEEASGGILLALPSGERWRFGAEDVRPSLEASVLFAVAEGRRPTRQIVLRMPRAPGARTASLRWIFVRA